MQRRIFFIAFFLLIATGVVIYGVMKVTVPEMTFAEAVKINDESKKVVLVGKGMNRPVTDDGAVVFYLTDKTGTAGAKAAGTAGAKTGSTENVKAKVPGRKPPAKRSMPKKA